MLAHALRGHQRLAGTEASFGGGDVFGAALLVRVRNISLSVLPEVGELPTKPPRNQLRNCYAIR